MVVVLLLLRWVLAAVARLLRNSSSGKEGAAVAVVTVHLAAQPNCSLLLAACLGCCGVAVHARRAWHAHATCTLPAWMHACMGLSQVGHLPPSVTGSAAASAGAGEVCCCRAGLLGGLGWVFLLMLLMRLHGLRCVIRLV